MKEVIKMQEDRYTEIYLWWLMKKIKSTWKSTATDCQQLDPRNSSYIVWCGVTEWCVEVSVCMVDINTPHNDRHTNKIDIGKYQLYFFKK